MVVPRNDKGSHPSNLVVESCDRFFFKCKFFIEIELFDDSILDSLVLMRNVTVNDTSDDEQCKQAVIC